MADITSKLMKLSRLCIALWQSHYLDLIQGPSLISLSLYLVPAKYRKTDSCRSHLIVLESDTRPLRCLSQPSCLIASQEHLRAPLTSPLTGGLERIETPQIIATCDNGPSDVCRSSVVISATANNHALWQLTDHSIIIRGSRFCLFLLAASTISRLVDGL